MVLILIGTIAIIVYEKFVPGYYALTIAGINGVIFSITAICNGLPTWRAQGFAVAKTAQEKISMKRRVDEQEKRRRRLSMYNSLIAIAIPNIIAILFGEAIRQTIGLFVGVGLSMGFLFAALCIQIVSHIFDKKIRNENSLSRLT
jgi:hypothetical protein